MKWGRTKSSPPIPLINRIFPVSWFFKSKQKGANKNQLFEFTTPKSTGLREGRFYSMDEDDGFWRLSFREGRKSTGGINPLWDCGDHLDHDFKSTKTEVLMREECSNFDEMVSDIKKMKERRGKQRIVAESSGEKSGISSRCKKYVDEERVIFPVESPVDKSRKQQTNKIVDQNLTVKEIKIKPESKKKSTYTNRGVKSYSPRTECKIRALEEMKKKGKMGKVEKRSAVFGSFAVAKSSFDPERDFRESMVEMIREKGIGDPEDLEQLLACYLTLNRDEYHDMIIKAFRQVWIGLNRVQNGVWFDCY